ncbi:MAG: UDP-N-acetylmuramoyl-tripeptide--D-alanyl-D-alanine ligase, partial [Acidobacteria bacterium]|nr:UDP-N-acetylmuramoyl-tripeptide--D-alanyl-D-alanine ligase [Acidobacteriota bacterium]
GRRGVIVAIVVVLGAVAYGAWRAVFALHMLQQDSYNNARYVKWTLAKPVARWLWPKVGEAKKPLAYTGRAWRILGVTWGLMVAVGAAGLYARGYYPYMAAEAVALAWPFFTVLANVLLAPVQSAINQGFVRQAQRRLQEYGPVVVGVAGSYGKTSTKYFVATILGEKFRVHKTPESFNTLLGVCRVINGNVKPEAALRPEHEVFVVEMGAYQRGEVRETAEMVRPRYGILTSIGPEHFERFLSMENIQATNYELIEALPKDGAAAFNCDLAECEVLARRTEHTKVLRYGVEDGTAERALWAEEIVHGAEGMSFTLVHRDGRRQAARTKLVGRHNVLNILGASLVALEMGLTLEEIARGIAKLEPAPHRLNIIHGAGGTIVIDDSYNSNPIGAAEALRVLGEFKTGRRILVAPGMIELGTLQAEKNAEFGRQAAAVCDFVYLIGPEQTRDVARGLREAGFAEGQLKVCRDLGEATVHMRGMLRAGDAILFENDLPDLYAE